MTVNDEWWVYMIKTTRGHFYTGIARDVDKRYQEHCDVANGKPNAKGAKFFNSQAPLEIVYRELLASRSQASKRESEIKKLSSSAKKKLALSEK